MKRQAWIDLCDRAIRKAFDRTPLAPRERDALDVLLYRRKLDKLPAPKAHGIEVPK